MKKVAVEQQVPLHLREPEEKQVPARAGVMAAPHPESQMAELLQELEKAELPRVLEMTELLRVLEMQVLAAHAEARPLMLEQQAVSAEECTRPELRSLA